LTESQLIQTLAKITVIFSIGLLAASFYKRQPAIRNWIWLICFVSPILFLIPLPTFDLPVLPQKEWLPNLESRVYELDPQFALRQTVYRGDPPWSSMAIWVGALAAVGLVVLAWRLATTLRVVRQAEQAVDDERLSLLYELGLAHGLSDVPILKRSDAVASPCVWGISQPVILVPASLECEENDWRLILEHELVHLAHRDPLRLIYFSIVRHALWWHPLVWFAFRGSELAQEEAVDQRLGNRAGYTRLLASVHVASPKAAMARPFGQSHLLTRVRNLARRPAKAPSRWGPLGLATLLPILLPVRFVTAYDPIPDQIGRDEVVFTSVRDGGGRLWRAASDGRNPAPMAPTFIKAGVPSISPDGKWLAYNRSVDGQEDIYVARVDGTDERRVVASSKRDVQPKWSRDGDKLLFCTLASGNWEIGLADVATQKWR
jgi:beta-lactamase regulating signal transducer with metallopeptidase domain